MEKPIKPVKVFSKVTSKGQVTIPKEIREKLGINEGDQLAFVEADNGEIVIKKAELVTFPSNPDFYRSYQQTKEKYGDVLERLKER
jgi:antitoxin PrlF